MIIAFLGESINRYRDNFMVFLDAQILLCPLCSSSSHWHGWYQRFVKDEEDPIPILRVKCCGCRKTHAVLPDFLSPYKQYPQAVQEAVIEQALEIGVAVEHIEVGPASGLDFRTCSPSIDTMRRWIRQYRQNRRQYIGAVASFLERHDLPIRTWNEGFTGFRDLVALAGLLVKQDIRGSCLLGKMNVLLAMSQPRLWI